MQQASLDARALEHEELLNRLRPMLGKDALDFAELRFTNLSRGLRWHPDFDDPMSLTHWNGADWSNAMQGEAGEAGNVVKKIRRHDTGLSLSKDDTRAELIAKLAEELADTIIYADLLAAYYGIDLGAAVREKFNIVSDREGYPEHL